MTIRRGRTAPAPVHCVVSSEADPARGHEATRVCVCNPTLAFGMQEPGLRVYVHRGDVRLEAADARQRSGRDR